MLKDMLCMQLYMAKAEMENYQRMQQRRLLSSFRHVFELFKGSRSVQGSRLC